MNHKFKLLLLIAFTLFATAGFSQPPSEGDLFEEINDVPIDGAIALLGVAGTALGIKSLYSRKK